MERNKILKRKSFRFIIISVFIALLPMLNIFSLGIELTSGIRLELLYVPAILCVPLIFLKIIEFLLDYISKRLKK